MRTTGAVIRYIAECPGQTGQDIAEAVMDSERILGRDRKWVYWRIQRQINWCVAMGLVGNEVSAHTGITRDNRLTQAGAAYIAMPAPSVVDGRERQAPPLWCVECEAYKSWQSFARADRCRRCERRG